MWVPGTKHGLATCKARILFAVLSWAPVHHHGEGKELIWGPPLAIGFLNVVREGAKESCLLLEAAAC